MTFKVLAVAVEQFLARLLIDVDVAIPRLCHTSSTRGTSPGSKEVWVCSTVEVDEDAVNWLDKRLH